MKMYLSQRRARWRTQLVTDLLWLLVVMADVMNLSRAAAQSSSSLLEHVGISSKLGAEIPADLTFTNADGNHVRLSDLLSNRPVILHLVYYECPMLCKLSNDGLLRTLDTLSLKLGNDFSIVTLSFDPREGPALSAKARDLAVARCGRDAVAGGWHFLTGDEKSIGELCHSVGFRYAWDEQTQQFAHAAGVFVLTEDGTLSRYLSGVEFSPRDLRLALVEASAGHIGTAADQALLMCYMYDPMTGKYGFAIMTAMRLAALATVGGLGIAIFTMLRRERAVARRSHERSQGGFSPPAPYEIPTNKPASTTHPTRQEFPEP